MPVGQGSGDGLTESSASVSHKATGKASIKVGSHLQPRLRNDLLPS